MNSVQLDLWQDEVDALPWGGRSPRLLAAQIVSEKVENSALARTGGVDNSVVCCRSREAQRFGMDPAQIEIWVPVLPGR